MKEWLAWSLLEPEVSHMAETNSEQAAIKDRNAAHPIATAWRPTLREVVKFFARGDYSLAAGLRCVAPISPRVSTQIQSYLEEYGKKLTELRGRAQSPSGWSQRTGRSKSISGQRRERAT